MERMPIPRITHTVPGTSLPEIQLRRQGPCPLHGCQLEQQLLVAITMKCSPKNVSVRVL